MKHTTKQSGRSRNKALAQRAAQLGCGISLLAVSAMLAARPARAQPDPASVEMSGFPADSGSFGFVTLDTQQINVNPDTNAVGSVTASLTDMSTSSTLSNTGALVGLLPSTATVTGNDLAALATGNAQTNTVDLANIGTSSSANGISLLAEQLNTFNENDAIFTFGTIDSSVNGSEILNQTVNAVNGDTRTNSSNLIEAQTTGNLSNSSVNGVVPLNYDQPAAGGATLLDAGGPDQGGSAGGNVVVGNSQVNAAIYGGNGSTADVYTNNIGLDINSTGVDPQSVTLSAVESNNAISSVFLGNSANNDINVSLTSGDTTGAPTFDGSLVVANQQADTYGGYGSGWDNSLTAYTQGNSIDTFIGGTLTPTITLTDGAVTENNNTISSASTGNSAVGAAGGPGNEISLGINLIGATPAIEAGNTVTSEGLGIAGGDLVLINQQYQTGAPAQAYTQGAGIGVTVQNLAGSSIGLANNAITSSALGNNASNAIETAAGAGIDLISGLAALNSGQGDFYGNYATSSYTDIAIYSGTLTGGLSLTNSTETLANNKITTTAGDNQVTNNISLTASTIDAGALGAAGGPAMLTSTVIGSPGTLAANAGISLNNGQYNGGGVNAEQYSDNIAVYAQGHTLSNDSLFVTNPLFTSEATANSATNVINADGSQGVSGSIGLLNAQAQDGGANAYLEQGNEDGLPNSASITLQSRGGAAGIAGSSAVLSGTEFYAEATDNYASNTLDATGGTLSNAGAAYGTLGLAAQLSDGYLVSAQAVSDLALTNLQNDFSAPAYADNYNSEAFINVDTTYGSLTSSSFVVSGPANNVPTAQALAIGNEAINALSALASTMLKDTAGLVNGQANTIGATALLNDNYVNVDINTGYVFNSGYQSSNDGGNISGVSVTVGTGAVGGSNANILRSLAYANQASNVLSVSAGTVNPDATAASFAVDGSVISDTAPYDTGLSGPPYYGVGAAYSLLSDQSSAGNVLAEATDPQIGIYMGNTITNPTFTDLTASTAGNAVVTSAFGNQASNSATVAANNLSSEDYYPVADVTNLQSNSDTVSSSLTYNYGIDIPMLSTDLYGTGTVLDSTLGVTNNTVLTQAEGNDATNSLLTTGVNITDVATSPLGPVVGAVFSDGTSAIPLAFSVQNVQDESSVINVDQTGASALVSTGGDVSYSTLTADSNALQAAGYGNNATNSLDFGGTTPVNLLDTSAGLQNTQNVSNDVNVTLGSQGTAAIPGDPALNVPAVSYMVSANDGENAAKVINTNTLEVIGQSLTFDVAGLTGSTLTAFEDALPGGSLNGNYYVLAPGNHTIANLAVVDGVLYADSGTALYDDGGSSISEQSVAAFVIPATDGTPAVPPSPSVLITVAGDITNSTLDVSNNAFDATAISNNAVNTQTIAATTVNGGADLSGSPAAGVSGDNSSANADYALVNNQSTGNVTTATAYGEAGINPTNASAITDSTLTADNNTQLAKAESNIASNTLTLSATDTGLGGAAPTLALVSNQSADASVTATAGTLGFYGLVVTAPGAITNSTLTMDNNSSEALAVVNNVTNLLSADATNLATATDGANATAYASPGGIPSAQTQADYMLTNTQTVFGDTVSASDVSYVINSDYSSLTSSGIVDSSANVSGNTTSAYAEANAASNTLDMTSTNSGATGGLTNMQNSAAQVEALGLGAAGFALTGGTVEGPAAATGSALNVTNNSTMVQGIGNQATNALNADTGATYGPQNAASTYDGGTEAAATYAVLNSQQNTGPVSAGGGAQYGSFLYGGGSATPVSDTTVTVSYNTVDIKAFGNSATNTATVSALNSGNATVALQNTQYNSGAVSAQGLGGEIGSTIGGPGASNVAVQVGNNSVIASAVGNVATNAIASH